MLFVIAWPARLPLSYEEAVPAENVRHLWN